MISSIPSRDHSLYVVALRLVFHSDHFCLYVGCQQKTPFRPPLAKLVSILERVAFIFAYTIYYSHIYCLNEYIYTSSPPRLSWQKVVRKLFLAVVHWFKIIAKYWKYNTVNTRLLHNYGIPGRNYCCIVGNHIPVLPCSVRCVRVRSKCMCLACCCPFLSSMDLQHIHGGGVYTIKSTKAVSSKRVTLYYDINTICMISVLAVMYNSEPKMKNHHDEHVVKY